MRSIENLSAANMQCCVVEITIQILGDNSQTSNMRFGENNHFSYLRSGVKVINGGANRGAGKPQIQFVPSQSWILSSDNIAKIIGSPDGPKKELLPSIVEAAVTRLSK